MQRLAIPARVALAAAGVGGAAYFANKSGMLTQIKQKLGIEGQGETATFTRAGVEPQTPSAIQPTEPPPPIVDTHSGS
jgi:hypothetical protein